MANKKNPAAVALGQLRAASMTAEERRQLGKARADALTKEQRVAIAKKGAAARWAGKGKKQAPAKAGKKAASKV